MFSIIMYSSRDKGYRMYVYFIWDHKRGCPSQLVGSVHLLEVKNKIIIRIVSIVCGFSFMRYFVWKEFWIMLL